MRAYELYETNLRSLGIYNPAEDQTTQQTGDTRTSTLTLRHLNLLKHIRRRNQQEHEKKLKFLPVIYGDQEFNDQSANGARTGDGEVEL